MPLIPKSKKDIRDATKNKQLCETPKKSKEPAHKEKVKIKSSSLAKNTDDLTKNSEIAEPKILAVKGSEKSKTEDTTATPGTSKSTIPGEKLSSVSQDKPALNLKLSTGKLAELKQKLLEHNKKKEELQGIKASRKEKDFR